MTTWQALVVGSGSSVIKHCSQAFDTKKKKKKMMMLMRRRRRRKTGGNKPINTLRGKNTYLTTSIPVLSDTPDEVLVKGSRGSLSFAGPKSQPPLPQFRARIKIPVSAPERST